MGISLLGLPLGDNVNRIRVIFCVALCEPCVTFDESELDLSSGAQYMIFRLTHGSIQFCMCLFSCHFRKLEIEK